MEKDTPVIILDNLQEERDKMTLDVFKLEPYTWEHYTVRSSEDIKGKTYYRLNGSIQVTETVKGEQVTRQADAFEYLIPEQCLQLRKQIKFGQVVFYSINNKTKTISEMGRSQILPIWEAMDIYANTHNPASQIVQAETEEGIAEEILKLEKRVQDPDWLRELFECI